MFVHDTHRFAAVRRLLEQGFTTRDVVAETGVPATTVGRWARGETRAFGPPVTVEAWRPPHPITYAYLLGAYLGDGHIVASRGRVWLRLFLDGAYPEIVDECRTAIGLARLGGSVSDVFVKDSRVHILQSSWNGGRRRSRSTGQGASTSGRSSSMIGSRQSLTSTPASSCAG